MKLPDHSTKEPNQADASIANEGELLRAVVRRITFKNDESGFGVIKIEQQGHDAQQVTLVGVLPDNLFDGAHILARGKWQLHPKFGRQFRAWSLVETPPTGAEALVRYLADGPVKGFGPILARRVVDYFGEETLRILDEEPDRLRDVSGIGEKKLTQIKAQWGQNKNLREILLFFQNHDISPALAQRIYRSYGDRAVEQVKANPYLLAREVWGIGFQTADRIAQALGIEPHSPIRVAAGLLHVLRRAGDDGHCFLPENILVTKTASLLGIADESLLSNELTQLVNCAEIIREDSRCYQPPLYQAEFALAQLIAGRLTDNAIPGKSITQGDLIHVCEEAFPAAGVGVAVPQLIHLSDEQRQAVELAATRNIVIITGGPGCGKTTVIRAITSLFRRAGLELRLCAPTGRAAQRLAEVCEMEASTIHRMLKFDPMKRSFLYDEGTPLAIDALIVDETSMIDLALATSLFKALPPRARVVFVGDADQLPSVGPGMVLAELLGVPSMPRVSLRRLFRRANESLITTIAHEINAARVPAIPEPGQSAQQRNQPPSDAYFLQADDPLTAAELVERLIVEQIPKRFGFAPSEITVLTPMNMGALGVAELNLRLQKRLVPPRPELPYVKMGAIEFRLGDRVCQRVNNYNITPNGVFNGDQGTVIGIDAVSRSLVVKLWDGREITYPSENIAELDLAYALTIHRAQGSEVPAVIVVIHHSHTILLERQLLYTAVTRAKKLLIIVGTRRALSLAVKRTRSKRRYVSLAERVSVALGGRAQEDRQ